MKAINAFYQRNIKGFTLIELMIVIAIIGILAAIAVPQFSAYKAKGYKAELMGDLKNAYTAAQFYFSDSANAANATATIDAAALTAGGYKASPNVSFTASTLTAVSGTLTLTHSKITGAGTVDYQGTVTMP
jgi:type IV pilus assembly protein PilA